MPVSRPAASVCRRSEGWRRDHPQHQAEAARLRRRWRSWAWPTSASSTSAWTAPCSAGDTRWRPTSRDSGGIFVNAEVTYRGVEVGRVTDMDLVDDGVRVELRIDPGCRPDPGGHRRGGRDPQCGGGAVRPPAAERRRASPTSRTARSSRMERTSIPVPVEQMLLNLDEFVGSIDQENLRIVIEELGRAFEGSGRRPGPADRQRRPAPRPRRGVAAADPAAHHRRPDRARHPERQPLGDPRSGRRTCGCSPTRSSTWTPTCAASWSTRRTPARPSQEPGRGRRPRAWAPWCATWTSSTGSRSRGWTAIQQMLITYPDAVTGGFTVVRRDEDGVLRSHFGFVLNAGDPHSCTTGYVASRTHAEPGRGRERRHRRRPLRGDQRGGPDPGRRLRRERLQHPGRRRTSAGTAAGAPRSRRSSSRAAAQSAAGRRRSPSCWAGCCTPTRSPLSRV